MSRTYLACLIALGASLSSCAESRKIGVAECATALESGRSCASREEFGLLQQHVRRQEASQLSERGDVAGALYSGHDSQLENDCKQIGPNDGFYQCGCYHDNDALAVRPNQKPAVYRSWTMWKPAPSATVFNEVQRDGVKHLFRDAAVRGMIPGIAYNPAVLPLPKKLAASWHPDAHYVAVARHSMGEEECKVKTPGHEFPWTGSDHSSVVLLNKHLETLVVGTLPMPIEDYRLFAFQGKVLVTANNVDRDAKDPLRLWSYRVFELELNFTRHHHNADQQCPKQLKVVLNEFKQHGVSDFDHKNSLFRFYGKNIGLMNSDKDGELQLLWRLSNPVAVMQWNSETLFTKLSSSALRNNGNPVYLPEHDAYLAFGHTFWEGNVIRHKEKHFVRNYVHRIVLFDAKPPYNWLNASKPLCLPAISRISHDVHQLMHEEWCEGIQFIMSWFREGKDILITYGVTDCEPAIARVPLAVLLGATSANFARHPDSPSDKEADLMNGTWKFDADEDRVMT